MPIVFFDNKKDLPYTTSEMSDAKLRQGSFLKKQRELEEHNLQVKVELAQAPIVELTQEEPTEEQVALTQEEPTEPKVEVPQEIAQELPQEEIAEEEYVDIMHIPTNLPTEFLSEPVYALVEQQPAMPEVRPEKKKGLLRRLFG